jgi:hypothetical protein
MAKNEEPGAPDSRPGPGVMKHVLWTLGASSLLVLLMFVWANNDPSMPPFLLTLPLGALGASLREFQMSLVGRTAGGGDSTYFRDASATATIARTIAGAALAALLNGLFISGMLKGFLFPDYHFKDETFESLGRSCAAFPSQPISMP